MFCGKCGTEVGDGRFCPKCGSRINEESQNTESTMEADNKALDDGSANVAKPEELIANNATEEESADNKVYNNNTVPDDKTLHSDNTGFNNNYMNNNMNNNVNQPGANNSKRQWPLITGIIAAVLIILSASIYFAWPMIISAVNPSYDAVAALKKTTAGFGEMMNDSLAIMDSDMEGDKQQLAGSLTIDKASFAGSDYMALMKANTINYELQFSKKEKLMAGTIGIGNGSSASELEMNVYMDSKELIFKVPALFSNSYRIDMSTVTSQSEYDSIFNLLMNYSEYMEPEEMKVISEAVVNSSVTAVNSLIDNLKYKKIGEEKYRSENGKIRAKIYNVTVSPQQIKDCIIEIVNNLYSDSTISSYTAMISLFGYSKDQIIQEIENTDFGTQDETFTIHVDDSQSIVKFIYEDKASIDSRKNQVVMEFIGKDDPLDYFKFSVIEDGTEFSFTSVKEDDSVTLKADYTPRQTGSTAGQHISISMKLNYDSNDGATVLASNFLIMADLGNNQKLDFQMSAESTVSELPSVNITKKSMGNPLNLDKMTDAQRQQMTLDLYRNFPVFKKILADPLYNTLYSSIYGYTG